MYIWVIFQKMYNWPKSKQKQAEFQKDHLHTSIDSDALPQQLRGKEPADNTGASGEGS